MVAYRLSEEVKTILAYILYGLSWISWILLLGGLSGVQSSCDTIAIGSRNIEQLDPSGFNCSSIFAYMWWILVLQALWLIILGYFINKSVVAKWRTVVIAMQLLLAIKGASASARHIHMNMILIHDSHGFYKPSAAHHVGIRHGRDRGT